MNLQSLELNNFRGVSHAVLPFDGKSAVIYGINGMAGTALVNNLKNIRNHKNRKYVIIRIC
jgi:predicted ATP-dependent endonuclease of OLD family